MPLYGSLPRRKGSPSHGTLNSAFFVNRDTKQWWISLQICSNQNETWNSDCELYRMRCLCKSGSPGCVDSKYDHAHVEYFGTCRDVPVSFFLIPITKKSVKNWHFISRSNALLTRWPISHAGCVIGFSTSWEIWLTVTIWVPISSNWNVKPKRITAADGQMPPFGSSVTWTAIPTTGFNLNIPSHKLKNI